MTDSYVSATHTRRQPKQNRSRALVDAIYQSCMKIIESGRSEKINVSLIAKTAGITLSSFYQYFPNVQSAIAFTILKYDQDSERYTTIKSKLQEHLLTPQEAVDFLVNSACERHLRLLNKYNRLYRSYHRLVNAQLCVGFNETGLAKMIHWDIWLKNFLQNYCETSFQANDLSIFVATSTLTELTSKALEVKPDLLANEEFKNKISKIILDIISI